MANRDLPHVFVQSGISSDSYTSPSSGRQASRPPFTGDRSAHARRLTEEFDAAITQGHDDSQIDGTYITFESFAGIELALESLDPRQGNVHPELISVKDHDVEGKVIQVATVFVPDGKHGYFLDRLEAYASSLQQAGNAKNARLIEGIRQVRHATIRDLWTDADEDFPEGPTEPVWWEVWCRSGSAEAAEAVLAHVASVGGKSSELVLGLGDRTVTLVEASVDQLSGLLKTLDHVAELRKPHVPTAELVEMDAVEQQAWADDLVARTTPATSDSPHVAILDVGVQDGHMLLQHSLKTSDCHTVDPKWTTATVDPHATEMAGIALYGDLEAAVLDSSPVDLTHRLESVRILPNVGANEPKLYGAISARAVDRVEIEDASRKRSFVMAVTHREENSGTPNSGRPTAWSATLDALAFGRAVDDTSPRFTYLDRDMEALPRLFVLSAGNVRKHSPSDDYPEANDLRQVEDPAHAWNALTVGAVASSEAVVDASGIFDNWTALVPTGELAPTSRTSVLFDEQWPFKPEVVAPGGNVAKSPDGTDIDTPPSLGILTTRRHSPGHGPFTTFGATSAASAFVSNIAGQVQAAYPDLRPETVRALIVHSARWTPEMQSRARADLPKAELARLRRRYGMGVPDASRAIHSARDALTLVSEGTIRPFFREGNQAKGHTRELNLHELPWPQQVLEDLSSTDVELRVTLSYFVEPNPSRRGWNARYAYPSHGLRFEVVRPGETPQVFAKRINKEAREDGEKLGSAEKDPGWLFGARQQRAPGSLHTDIWRGPAADLATRNAVAVYPVAGWWKDRPAYDQSDKGVHYSLVVSIETPTVASDLWTPVMQQLSLPIEIA